MLVLRECIPLVRGLGFLSYFIWFLVFLSVVFGFLRNLFALILLRLFL